MTRSKRPRLLCLVQLPPPVHGASVVNERVVNSERLAKVFELDVLPLQFASSVEDIGRPSLEKAARAAAVALRLVRQLALGRPAGVYFTLSPIRGAFYRDCVYVAIIKAFGVPRIYHIHGKGISAELGQGWRRALYRWAFRGANVIHLSRALSRDTEELVDSASVQFVPNGVPNRLQATSRTPQQEPARILYLSNMVAEKGPLVLLDALSVLRDRGVAFTATFAGAPFGDCLQSFEANVQRLKLDDRVRYVGPKYGAEKDALFREHDVFAFPTFYAQEAFPLVLLEAMQFGLPVVTTPEGAIPEIVIDGETGFLVPQRDAAVLADRLRSLIDDRDLRERMGTASGLRYRERFTLEHFEETLVAAIQTALAPSSGP